MEVEWEKSQRRDEVDTVKEEAGSRDMVKHIENSDQLLIEKTM